MEFPWLAPALTQVLHSFSTQQLAHALILGADQGYGGEQLAAQIAQLVLCRTPTTHGACQHCKSCSLYLADAHPDLYQLAADGQQIKVDQIRELSQKLMQTPQQGGYRVAIIEQAHRMNTAAANALLKTLEEPGEKTLLILQTGLPQRLLPTIRSRCLPLKIQLPASDAVQQWLDRYSSQRIDASWALPLAAGPLTLLAAIEDGRYQLWSQWRQDWQQSLRTGHLTGSLLQLKDEDLPTVLILLYGLLKLKLSHQQHKKRLEQQHEMQKEAGLTPFQVQALASFATQVMQQSYHLSTAASVNSQALCQSYVLRYQQILFH